MSITNIKKGTQRRSWRDQEQPALARRKCTVVRRCLSEHIRGEQR